MLSFYFQDAGNSDEIRDLEIADLLNSTIEGFFTSANAIIKKRKLNARECLKYNQNSHNNEQFRCQIFIEAKEGPAILVSNIYYTKYATERMVHENPRPVLTFL